MAPVFRLNITIRRFWIGATSGLAAVVNMVRKGGGLPIANRQKPPPGKRAQCQ
ncbi:Hypothetical protein NGAL_HAMBI1189_55810 [Neorhizobium galegae bv. officinalis]|uniref:Uncharacterized protein n=1 Tax=Neorhizobium galegae bv. officinalis TaxID=323656 RepID=A0A0T7H555_NEOGA|nr:Hypothetical protein NGAL_HAMBI1189_55810 [Neorhizobium galegae bv. officinalis]